MNEGEITQSSFPVGQPPEQNVRSFKLMYAIENGIRELIIELLSKLDGPLWYKRRLPSDVLEKYREGVELQRRTKSMNLIPHHHYLLRGFPRPKKDH